MTDYERWLESERQRVIQEKLDEKRSANVNAKDATAPVQMKWAPKSPAQYHKELARIHGKKVVYNSAQQESNAQAAIRREFVLEARRVYRLMDGDRSQGLDYDELKFLTASDEAAKYLIDLWDTDGDGKVSMQEWLDFTTGIWDENPDGAEFLVAQVEATLSRRAFTVLASRLFRKADSDGSGHLDFAEVVALCEDERGGLSESSFEMFYEGMDKVKSTRDWTLSRASNLGAALVGHLCDTYRCMALLAGFCCLSAPLAFARPATARPATAPCPAITQSPDMARSLASAGRRF